MRLAPQHLTMNPQPPEPPPPLPGEHTEFVRVNGLQLLCRQWGDPESPPLVLLHGLRGFSGTWRTLAAALSQDYRLLAFDQRGRGDSDWDPGCNYYTDAYLADLEGIVEHFGLRRFALLGHSMGGTTAYAYADRHPLRLTTLLIEDIAPGSSVEGPGARRVVAEMAALPDGFDSWADARAYWRSQRPTIGEEALEQRLADSLCELPTGAIRWRYDARGISRTRINPDSSRIVDLWPVIDRLRIRTGIIRGERSDFCPTQTVEDMCRRNPRITCVTVPGASHYVHDDAPAQFAKHVGQFLSRGEFS